MADWLREQIVAFTKWWPENTFFNQDFMVQSLLAIILVSLLCGAVGALVVGNRMAFFSDALAHCAFAGVALGVLVGLILGAQGEEFRDKITMIMIVFGIMIGLSIAFVQEKTGLPSDTVIGVFFAGALGLGGMFQRIANRRFLINLESFLFGNPLSVTTTELLVLAGLVLLTLPLLAWMYNSLLFATFNPSLARSRRVPVRLCNYLFVVLLGLIVNLCLNIVGTLLINALLIVPAAAASNLCRNMRQLFWWSIGLCLFSGVAGQILCWEINCRTRNENLHMGIGGSIVVLSVIIFLLSALLGPWWRERSQKVSQPS